MCVLEGKGTEEKGEGRKDVPDAPYPQSLLLMRIRVRRLAMSALRVLLRGCQCKLIDSIGVTQTRRHVHEILDVPKYKMHRDKMTYPIEVVYGLSGACFVTVHRL
jgi:hypothetical protein